MDSAVALDPVSRRPRWTAPRVPRALAGAVNLRCCARVKNITVSVDDDLHSRARVRAAEMGTTVSALVREYLVRLVTDEAGFDSLLREQDALIARIRRDSPGFGAAQRVTRDEVHQRDAFR